VIIIKPRFLKRHLGCQLLPAILGPPLPVTEQTSKPEAVARLNHQTGRPRPEATWAPYLFQSDAVRQCLSAGGPRLDLCRSAYYS
jgi:hypothetical protein